jgi:hypothetical protein
LFDYGSSVTQWLPMIKFFSRLPMRALYALATFLYLLAFYVVRHRHSRF